MALFQELSSRIYSLQTFSDLATLYPRKGCHLLLTMDHSDPAQESAMPVPVAMANSNSNMADVSSVQAYNFVPMFNPEEMAARRREQREQART